MDDYIQNHGADRFKRQVMGKVVDLAAWEKQFQTSTGQTHLVNKVENSLIY